MNRRTNGHEYIGRDQEHIYRLLSTTPTVATLSYDHHTLNLHFQQVLGIKKTKANSLEALPNHICLGVALAGLAWQLPVAML